MAPLYNRGPSLGPIAPFKTRPKVVALGRVLNAAQGLTLGHVSQTKAACLKRGFRPNLKLCFKHVASDQI